MALKEVAVEGMTFKFVNSAHSGIITITDSPSTKVAVLVSTLEKFVYLNNLSITIASGTDGTVTSATGSGTMTATSLKNLAEDKAPLRLGDQSIVITMIGSPPSGSTSPTEYTTIVEIDDAGQTKYLAE